MAMKLPARLRAYKSGPGWEIQAFIEEEADCAEFTLAATWQRILQCEGLVGYSPWIQFDMSGLQDMWGRVYKKMVILWNKKYATISEKEANKRHQKWMDNRHKHDGVRRPKE